MFARPRITLHFNCAARNTLKIESHLEPISKLLRIVNAALKTVSKCSFTACKLRFLNRFCLASTALANFEIGSTYERAV
jgi:hypothetical protein